MDSWWKHVVEADDRIAWGTSCVSADKQQTRKMCKVRHRDEACRWSSKATASGQVQGLFTCCQCNWAECWTDDDYTTRQLLQRAWGCRQGCKCRLDPNRHLRATTNQGAPADIRHQISEPLWQSNSCTELAAPNSCCQDRALRLAQ